MANADIGPMNVNQQKTGQPDTIGELLGGGLLQAPKSNVVQSVSVTVEDMPHQENKKNPFPAVKKYNALDDGINVEDDSKIPIENIYSGRLQKMINGQSEECV